MKANLAQQWISIDNAFELTRGLAKKFSLGAKEVSLVESIIASIPQDPQGIRMDQLVGHMSNLQKAFIEKDASFLEQRRGYKVERIVDIHEFAESREFCNLKGALWPTVKEDLWRMWHVQPVPSEIVLGGAAGTAKSTKSAISMAYTIYLLSTLHNPQLELEMIPTDDIFIILQSLRLSTAEEALFFRVQRMLDGSPYFQQNFQRDKKINSELIFPSFIKVKAATGAADAAISLNVIGYVVSEINFMPVHKQSVRLENSDKEVFDVGGSMYGLLNGRWRNRFAKFIARGDFFGKGIADSARSHVGDFMEHMIEEAENDPTILVIERSLWSARAHDFPPSSPRFFVQLGSDYHPPRILEKIEDADNWSSDFDVSRLADDDYLMEMLNVIRVPELYRTDFDSDIEEALKDKAGVPSRSSGRFLPFTEEIKKAQTKHRERTGGLSLFNLQEIKLQKGVSWEELVCQKYLAQLALEGEFNWAVHVDTSLGRNDAAGLAVGRIIDSLVVDNGHFYDVKSQEVLEFHNVEMPVYIVDGCLRILAPTGGQIDLNLLRDLVLHLKKHINIRYASADWIESTSMLQAWRDNDIISGKRSVDKTPEAYFELKHAIKDGRILMPAHEVLEKELRGLKRISTRGSVKIEHQSGGGSKDVSDSVAAIISVLKATEGRMRLIQRDEDEEDGNRDSNNNNSTGTPNSTNSGHSSYPQARMLSIGTQRGGWRRW